MAKANMTAVSSIWVGMCDEYDTAGNCARHYKRMELQYTDGARIIEERYFKPDGAPDYRYEYVYATGGALVEKRMILGEAHGHGRWVYTSEGNRILSAVWFNDRGEAEAEDTYIYEAGGQTAVRTRKNVGEWRHEYDNAGREVRVSGGPYSGVGVERIEYIYDGDGHILRMEHHGFIRYVITFTRKQPQETKGTEGGAP
jgi:hypothetical protein